MKVTFLNPPSIKGLRVPERVFGCTYGLYPIPNIFVLTYAAVLEETGHDVRVVDAPVEGWSERDLVDFLMHDDSEAYVFYSVNLSKKIDQETTRLIRKFRGKDVPVIFTGPGPSYQPYAEDFLLDRHCYVLRGEVDFALWELVEKLEHGVDISNVLGLSWIANGSVRHNPPPPLIRNLDILPFPARHLIKRELYYNPKLGDRPFTAMLTQRGCPYRCKFCVPNALSFSRKLQFRFWTGKPVPPMGYRSPAKVIEEFKMLESDGYKTLTVIDDEFILQKRRTMEILEGIKGIKIRWSCLARADYLIDREVVRALAEANCVSVDIGAESFVQKILDDMRKHLKVETIEKAVKNLKDFGIEPKLNILFGASPLETEATIRYTIKKTIELKPGVVMFNIANPFPGTEFYEDAKKNGWFVFGDYVPVDVQKESIISYPHLPKKRLEYLTKLANFKYYANPKLLWSHLRRFHDPIALWKSFKSFLKKFRGFKV